MIYFFMERLRLLEGLPKSQERLKNEKMFPSGFVSIVGRSGGTNDWSMTKASNGATVPASVASSGITSYVKNWKILDHDSGVNMDGNGSKPVCNGARGAWETKKVNGDDKAVLPISSCEFC